MGEVAATDSWLTSRGTAVRVAAYEAGVGDPAVVVLHGLGTGVDVLRQAVVGLDPYAALRDEGLHVLAVDLPGHGRSGGPRGHLSYRLAMEATAEAVRVARQRWSSPVALAGTGLGGVLAFYAALEGDGVGAVACHCALDLRDIRPVLRRRRQRALLPMAAHLGLRLPTAAQRRVPLPTSAVMAPGDMARDPEISAALRSHPQWVARYDLGGLASILLSPRDKPDVGAQSVPTLVCVGARDAVMPADEGLRVAGRVAGAETWVHPTAGHQLLLEAPGEALPRMAAFLRRHLMG